MSVFPPSRLTSPNRAADDVNLYEIDGPPVAYFEIPLEHWVTANGELEPPGHPGAVRLGARIAYRSFSVATRDLADDVVDAVKKEVRALGGGIIWWRKHITEEFNSGVPRLSKFRFRLATSPELPWEWWVSLGELVGNASSDISAPGGKNGRRL